MSWTGRMIGGDPTTDVAPRLRHEVELDRDHGAPVAARLRLSALGVVEAWINGHPVSDAVLTPGWTSYDWRLRYLDVDVTGLVDDVTVLAMVVGNGWYRGRLGWHGTRAHYGPDRAGWAELEIDFADGHRQLVATGPDWRTAPSEVLADDLYDGQTIDARERSTSWLVPGHDVDGWAHAVEVETDLSVLTPYVGPPVVRQEELRPVSVGASPSGRTLVDFGQNLVGWVRAEVHGPRGRVVTLRHAEVLEDGELGTRPLRSAEATDRFVLSGEVDRFEPTLTFHGFRYAEVDGWPEDQSVADGLTAVVVGSDLRRTGDFACSDDLVNQLHTNVVWGMRGNFLDVPTDCPQRDERMGWTGDIAVFAPTAAYLFDVRDFLRDWLRDLAAEQANRDGMVPFVVPDVLERDGIEGDLGPQETTAVWSDASVWVPWALWEAYGDLTVLAEQWGSMAAHGRRVRSLLSDRGVWETGFQFGDWLDPDAPPDDPAAAKADPGVVATACAYRTATMLQRTAALLEDQQGSDEFARMAADLRTAFGSAYVADGRVHSDCVTVYALAIEFGLLDEPDLSAAGERLAGLVAERDFRISTGFAGTPFVTDALTRTGHLDHAYRLLTERGCPSWLYPVTMGATTVWERWDSMLPDGSINPGEMTSFNHYALGAVVDWVRRTVGGLAATEPGYRTLAVAPRPGGGITWARTSLETPHGTARLAWRIEGEEIAVDVDVPDGVHARVDVPTLEGTVLDAGEHHLRAPLRT